MIKKGINRYWGNSIKKNYGFTLSEALISLLVIGVILACSVPLMTQFSEVKTNLDKSVFDCIVENDSDPWYDESDGDTVVPDSGTDSTCFTAVMDVIYNRGKALNTAKYYADRGSSTRQEMAKKILRAACDAGGDKACDYFVDKCWESTEGCDLTDAAVEDVNTDVRYYLKKLKTEDSRGVEYIYKKYKTTLPKMTRTLAYESVLAQSGGDDSLAEQFAKPELFIKACNSGNKTACEIGYNFGYNLSCYEIRDHWKEAPSGTYQLTNDASGASHSLFCQMTNEASATISACNQNDLINGRDCLRGKDMHYNQTCEEVFTSWPGAPDGGTFNLTETMVFPFDRDEVICYAPVGDKDLAGYSVGAGAGSGGATVAPPDPVWGNEACGKNPGYEMSDGTVYAGDDGGTYKYFVTPEDAGSYVWDSAPFIEDNAKDSNDGAANTGTLAVSSDYEAAYYCGVTLNNDSENNLGYTDWYLPAENELDVLNDNRTVLGLSGWYWSSTNASSGGNKTDYAMAQDMSSETDPVVKLKNTEYNVRCMRKVQDKCSSYNPTCGVISITTYDDDTYTTTHPIMITTCNVEPPSTLTIYSSANNELCDAATQPCCWYSKGISCNTTGCGNEVTTNNYDKYTCDHDGAVAVCHALNGNNPEQYGEGCDTGECTVNSSGWRLPTSAEVASLRVDPSTDGTLSTTAGTLGLCDYFNSVEGYCGQFSGCKIDFDIGYCNPFNVWSADAATGSNFYGFTLLNGSLNGPGSMGNTKPLSVRCVRSL